jgi:4-hydroxy-tetrahydrodipicolinate synthase
MNQFSGIWVPLITPFTSHGAVDYENLGRIVRDLVDAGIDGFVALGTTGEPSTLSDEEMRAVVNVVLDHCGSRPVVVGASGMTTEEVCAQLAGWKDQRLAGALVTAPYYVRPSQQAIVEFFTDIAARTEFPLVVYDIPYRTGVHMELSTLRAIACLSSVRAIKDCGGDARKTQALIADGRLAVMSGEDHLIFHTVCQGGAGAIAASAHLHPRLFVAMHRALRDQRLAEAQEIHHALAPLVEALFVEPNPAPLKAVLARLSYANASVRRPLLQASPEAAQRAWHAYQGVELALAAMREAADTR